MESEFFFLLLTTILAGFLGYELISKIPQTLHTPLMSGSNAISGITIIAALTFVEKLGSNEFLITLIFIVILVSGVYFYAGYLTRTGKAEDADGNFIPDSWEENFGWFFSAKGLIMFALGLLLGYVLGVQFPDIF